MKARAAVILILTLTACAPKVPTLPSGPGAPFSGFANAYQQATEGCKGVRTLTAVLSLSGRVGTQRLRGRIDAGLDAPDRIVLEAVAPFGKSFFVLAGSGDQSTLVLPRDDQFLQGAPPEAIVEAMTGVSLDPAELRMVLAGCGIPAGDAGAGRAFDGGWASIETGGSTTWLRRVEGRWRVAAATRGPMTIRYSDFSASRPATVRIGVRSATEDGFTADVRLGLTDVNVNVPLDPGVFTLAVPPGAMPITLDDLRRAGPLGQRDS